MSAQPDIVVSASVVTPDPAKANLARAVFSGAASVLVQVGVDVSVTASTVSGDNDREDGQHEDEQAGG